MLNVRQLRVLRTVMQTGSVSAASRILHISQPAVTKSIHLIESTVGITLFARIKGRLVQTPEAEEMLPELDRLFGTLQSIEELAERVRDGFVGQIRVATVAALSSSVVAAAMVRFQKERTGVRFDIRALSTRHVIDYVSHDQVEIGVIDVPISNPEIEMRELCSAEIGCVMPKKHRLARARAITPAMLSDENLITFAEDTLTGMSLREALCAAGGSFRIVYTTNQTLSAYSLVRSGAGIALVDPFPALDGSFGDLVVRPFRPVIVLRPQIILSRRKPTSRLALDFVETLKDVAQELASQPRSLLSAYRK